MARVSVARVSVAMLSIAMLSIAVSCGSSDPAGAPGEVSPAVVAPASDDSIADVEPADSTTTVEIPATTVPIPGSFVVHDFADPNSVEGWSVQNDTVMGGVSRSGVDWLDGTLVFAGNVSLDNNGGFASLRGPLLESPPTDVEELVVSMSGDGKTYVMQLVTSSDSFIRRFVAEPGESEQTMPLDEFEATSFMLEPVTPRNPLVSADVRQIAVYILDKQEGEFELRLRSIAMR